ncbi:MAG: histidinol-phosphatase HisJ family protein [Promethearchaeota archaeon]
MPQLIISLRRKSLIPSKNSHRPFRLYEKLPPSWDYDLHIHTNWSQDNIDGPYAKDWLQLGKRYKICLGFTDHFEIGNIDPRYQRNQAKNSWKLSFETIDSYLEEFDELRNEKIPFVLGLEVSYHPDYTDSLWEFLDSYYSQFDYIVGSIHELALHQAVTVKETIFNLQRNQPQMEEWVDLYFNRVKEMIKVRRFDVIAHPDVIFRFLSYDSLPLNVKSQYREKILELGWLCDKYKTFLEINLSGYRSPWQDSFPKDNVVTQLLMEEIPMVVGSDSHQLSDFLFHLPTIRRLNHLLSKNWKFTYKFDPSIFSG